MKKQIAVLMCSIALDNQRKLFDGMIKAGKETDCNLYFFSNYINSIEREENIEGSYHVFRLPDFKEFDGAIIAKNLIRHKQTADYVEQALKDSKIPTVSIDTKIDGMGFIGVSTYEAQMELIEHLIVEHHYKKIAYVSGPFQTAEGKKRYEAYCDILKKYGIEYNEKYVYEGYFDVNSGRKAVRKFLEYDIDLEAIVCANDDMAFGVMDCLKKNGYRIPEDIKVTGFDDIEFAHLCTPSLTTMNKKQEEIGYHSVYKVLSLIEGNETTENYMPCELKIRNSCGCEVLEQVNLEYVKKRFMEQRILTRTSADMVRRMISDFSSMESLEELIDSFKKCMLEMENVEDMDAFYLCLCDKEKIFVEPGDDLTGSLDISQINKDYTEEVTIPMAYENGEFHIYGPFPKGKVLPDELKNQNGGNYFVISPINYRRLCFGYSVIKNSLFPANTLLYYSWIVDIGIGLENVRKWVLLKDTVVKLNNLWAYDMMTHLYNRAGFYHYAMPLMRKMCEKDERVFLAFMDIDGLKIANDTMGHEVGDWMIQEIASVIKENLSNEQIAMRYGGDEFVILGSVETDEQLEQLQNDLQESMHRRNMRSDNLFELRASVGVSVYHAKEVKNLDMLIEEADKKMYEEKRRRKKLAKLNQQKENKPNL